MHATKRDCRVADAPCNDKLKFIVYKKSPTAGGNGTRIAGLLLAKQGGCTGGATKTRSLKFLARERRFICVTKQEVPTHAMREAATAN